MKVLNSSDIFSHPGYDQAEQLLLRFSTIAKMQGKISTDAIGAFYAEVEKITQAFKSFPLFFAYYYLGPPGNKRLELCMVTGLESEEPEGTGRDDIYYCEVTKVDKFISASHVSGVKFTLSTGDSWEGWSSTLITTPPRLLDTATILTKEQFYEKTRSLLRLGCEGI